MFGKSRLLKVRLQNLCKNFAEVDEVIAGTSLNLHLVLSNKTSSFHIDARNSLSAISVLSQWRAMYQEDIASAKYVAYSRNPEKKLLEENIYHTTYILSELCKILKEQRLVA